MLKRVNNFGVKYKIMRKNMKQMLRKLTVENDNRLIST